MSDFRRERLSNIRGNRTTFKDRGSRFGDTSSRSSGLDSGLGSRLGGSSSRFGGGDSSDGLSSRFGDRGSSFGGRSSFGSSRDSLLNSSVSEDSDSIFGGRSRMGSTDMFSRSNDLGGSPFGSRGSSLDVTGLTRGNVPGSYGGQTQQPQQQKDIYDRVFDGVVSGAKNTAKGVKNVVKLSADVKDDFKEWDRKMKLGDSLMKFSLVQIGISVVFMFVLKMNTIPMLLAHSFTAVGGLVFSRMNYLYPEEREQHGDMSNVVKPVVEEDTPSRDFSFDGDGDGEEDDEEDFWGVETERPERRSGFRHAFQDEKDDLDEDSIDEDDDDEITPLKSFSLDDDEEDDLDSDDSDSSDSDSDDLGVFQLALDEVNEMESSVDVTGNPDEILESIKNTPSSLVNRNTLYDAYVQVLDGFNKGFGKRVELSSSDSIWKDTEAKIQAAQRQSGLKLAKSIDDDYETEDKYSTITRYVQGDLIDEIYLTRPNGMTESAVNKFNTELTSILKGLGLDTNHYVFSNAKTSGDTLYVEIFKGSFPAVTLKDLLLRQDVRDYMTDTDNAAPIVLGYDELGKPLMFDLLNLENMLIAGQARSGKSVVLTSIMSQACMLNSPAHLQLWVGDSKMNGNWSKFRLPHVKHFAENGVKVLDMLNDLKKTEIPRRLRILEESGFGSIKAYREANPDDKTVPFIYVVLDEWMNITGDIKTYDAKHGSQKFAEYSTLLLELVTKYPYLDIRLIGIPHIVKDSAVPKRVTDMITSRAVFRASKTVLAEVFKDNAKEINNLQYNTDGVGVAIISTPLIKNSSLTLLRACLFGMGSGLKDKVGMEKSENKVIQFQKELWSELEPEIWKESYWHLKEMEENANRELGL